MSGNSPRPCCYSTVALKPELRAAFDKAAERSSAALARVCGVGTHVIDSLCYGGLARKETVEKVEVAFVAYQAKRSA